MNLNKEILKETLERSYNSEIFGEYTLKFKIYEKEDKFIVKIENSLTENVFTMNDEFSEYKYALIWAKHLKDRLINKHNKNLLELIQG